MALTGNERLVNGAVNDLDGRQVVVLANNGTGTSAQVAAPTDAFAAINGAGVVAEQMQYNGATWDRTRGVTEATALASAVRAATNASADLTNFNGTGAIVTLDITVVPGVDTVQLVVEGKDAVSGKYYTLVQDAAQAGAVTRVAQVHPGVGAAAGGISVSASFVLPRVWRVRVVHSAATNFTYSVGVVTTA